MSVRLLRPVFLAAAIAVLTACGGSGNGEPDSTTTVLNFFPLSGVVPSPNDLAFAGSEDGTVNAPTGDSP
ncbi:MAG: hypothetical protein PVF40_06505, partial [Ectothiorhodospiraceae bacterium]